MSEHSHDRDWKLRIIVDAHLSTGQQVAQSLHAAIEFTQEHPQKTRHWHRVSNSIICMASQDIEAFHRKCLEKGIIHSCFYEPDMDNRLTAIALEPTAESRKLTSSLPLVR